MRTKRKRLSDTESYVTQRPYRIDLDDGATNAAEARMWAILFTQGTSNAARLKTSG